MPITKTLETAVESWYLEYRSGTSDKFYHVMVADNGLVVLRWGRRGTSGQHSEARYRTYDEAHDHGLKQVYAKKSKGYVQHSSIKFLATIDALNRAQEGYLDPLVRRWREALANGEVSAAKETVLKHYEEFSDRVQRLLNRASTEDFAALTDEFESIEAVWGEISDKHAEVTAAMNLVKATLFQKMMAGQ